MEASAEEHAAMNAHEQLITAAHNLAVLRQRKVLATDARAHAPGRSAGKPQQETERKARVKLPHPMAGYTVGSPLVKAHTIILLIREGLPLSEDGSLLVLELPNHVPEECSSLAEAVAYARKRFPKGRQFAILEPGFVNALTCCVEDPKQVVFLDDTSDTWRGHCREARLHQDAGQFTEAEFHLAHALRHVDHGGLLTSLLTNLSACHLEAGQPLQALAWAATALSVDKQSHKAWYRAALALDCMAMQARRKAAAPAKSVTGASGAAPGQAGAGQQESSDAHELVQAAHDMMLKVCELQSATKQARTQLLAQLKSSLPSSKTKATTSKASQASATIAPAAAEEVMLGLLTGVNTQAEAFSACYRPAASSGAEGGDDWDSDDDAGEGADDEGAQVPAAAAAAAKERGNGHFQSQRFDEAARCYLEGLAALARPAVHVLLDQSCFHLRLDLPLPGVLGAYGARMIAPALGHAHFVLGRGLAKMDRLQEAAMVVEVGLRESKGGNLAEVHEALRKLLVAIKAKMAEQQEEQQQQQEDQQQQQQQQGVAEVKIKMAEQQATEGAPAGAGEASACQARSGQKDGPGGDGGGGDGSGSSGGKGGGDDAASKGKDTAREAVAAGAPGSGGGGSRGVRGGSGRGGKGRGGKAGGRVGAARREAGTSVAAAVPSSGGGGGGGGGGVGEREGGIRGFAVATVQLGSQEVKKEEEEEIDLYAID